MPNVLEIQDLNTWFFTREGVAKAVNGVSFHIEKGEILGVVGESGCGKSVTATSILRLVPHPGKIVSGRILLHGEDLLHLPMDRMKKNKRRPHIHDFSGAHDLPKPRLYHRQPIDRGA